MLKHKVARRYAGCLLLVASPRTGCWVLLVLVAVLVLVLVLVLARNQAASPRYQQPATSRCTDRLSQVCVTLKACQRHQ